MDCMDKFIFVRFSMGNVYVLWDEEKLRLIYELLYKDELRFYKAGAIPDKNIFDIHTTNMIEDERRPPMHTWKSVYTTFALVMLSLMN